MSGFERTTQFFQLVIGWPLEDRKTDMNLGKLNVKQAYRLGQQDEAERRDLKNRVILAFIVFFGCGGFALTAFARLLSS